MRYCNSTMVLSVSAQTRLKLDMMAVTMVTMVTVTVRVNHIDGDGDWRRL